MSILEMSEEEKKKISNQHKTAIKSDIEFASLAGLSHRIALNLGNLVAMPDLWRLEYCTESNAISTTKVFSTSLTGPNF